MKTMEVWLLPSKSSLLLLGKSSILFQSSVSLFFVVHSKTFYPACLFVHRYLQTLLFKALKSCTFLLTNSILLFLQKPLHVKSLLRFQITREL